MSINIILMGAMGIAGSGVLRQAIADADVARITILTRRPLRVEHEKLQVITHTDFTNYSDVASQLVDHQAALWCLGISQNVVTKEEYNVITYNYAIAAVKAFGAVNLDSFKFLFLSGADVDSTEKSRFLFVRVKGKTENALANLGHPSSITFRLLYIHPDVRTKRSFGGMLMDAWAVPTYNLLPAVTISATDLGKVMLNVAKYGFDKLLLPNADIWSLATRYTARFAESKSEVD